MNIKEGVLYMKATIEIDLDKYPQELKMFINRDKFYGLLQELKDYRRTLYKYEEREVIPVEEIIDKINMLTSNVEYDDYGY